VTRRYGVIVTPEAEAGIVAAFQYILERSPLNAEKWLRALYKKIDSLEQMPERCPLARENEYFEDTLRHLVFKSHRIIFRIDEAKRSVQVLYVRHAKQRAVGEPIDDDTGEE
jgi:plasmid stabilization system protein ParE